MEFRILTTCNKCGLSDVSPPLGTVGRLDAAVDVLRRGLASGVNVSAAVCTHCHNAVPPTLNEFEIAFSELAERHAAAVAALTEQIEALTKQMVSR